MITAYRMFKSKHSAKWHDGEGAFRYGGRWNSPGIRLLYASSSVSLGALEILANLGEERLLLSYSFAKVEFSDRLAVPIEKFSKLSHSWGESPAPAFTKEIGDEWARSQKSVVLDVPSSIVPSERNFIINIEHPAFSKVILGAAETFSFDRRLRKS